MEMRHLETTWRCVCVGGREIRGKCEKDVNLLRTDTGRGRRQLTERKNINKRRERERENRPVRIVQGRKGGTGVAEEQ